MPRAHYRLMFLLCFCVIASQAQTGQSFFSHADSTLTKHSGTYPAEKVYLHLNKPFYYRGDTIWYKAYVVAGPYHQLSGISGVLYVELIGPRDTVVTRQLLKLTAGLGRSELPLAVTIKPGNYRMRAYTNWMRNRWSENFYEQKVRIGGDDNAAVPGKQPAKEQADVEFFPEGGELVSGLRSRVAFKAVNSKGLGEEIKGIVQDNDGNTVADISSQHAGMGVFALTPQAGKTYRAKITGGGEASFTVDLPKVSDAGFCLAVDNRAQDSIYIKIAANEKCFESYRNREFYLVAQTGGKLYYTTAGKLTAPIFAAGIAKQRFPSGIVQFTLFSDSGEPLNERIAFVLNGDTLNIKTAQLAKSYAPRQKVSIELVSGGAKTPALSGSYSVSVINETRVPVDENAEGTILNNLLLTSDLKGYIEQPNYYFTNADAQKRANLDLLMLTQGYRKFEWKEVLGGTPQQILYKPEADLQLEGMVKTPAGKPVIKGGIILTAPRQNLITDTTTDENGEFRFTGLDLPDTGKVIIRARKENKGSNVNIYVKEPTYPFVIKQYGRDDNEQLSPGMQQAVADQIAELKKDSLKKGRQLKEVVIKAKRGPRPDKHNGYGAVYEFDVDMKRMRLNYPIITHALSLVIPGLKYIGNNGFKYENRPVQHFIIDDFERSVDDFDFYSPKEVESIRMIGNTIILTTKRYAGTDTASTVQLKQVNITATRKPKPDMSSSSNFHGGGNADQVILADDMGVAADLEQGLQRKIFGVTFDASGVPVNTRDLRGGKMSIIIDGITLTKADIKDININDVYSVEVLRTGAAKAIYGTSIDKGGALIITTRRGIDPKYTTSTDPAGLIHYPFKGYHKARAFYSPKYDANISTGATDLRNAIYWDPDIAINEKGKATIEYFNADTKGTYRILVEGIDADGNLGRAVYRYKVE